MIRQSHLLWFSPPRPQLRFLAENMWQKQQQQQKTKFIHLHHWKVRGFRFQHVLIQLLSFMLKLQMMIKTERNFFPWLFEAPNCALWGPITHHLRAFTHSRVWCSNGAAILSSSWWVIHHFLCWYIYTNAWLMDFSPCAILSSYYYL